MAKIAFPTLKLIATFALIVAAPSTVNAQGDAATKALFGELHVHTKWSFDAYVFSVRATPDDAYEFAKGKPLRHPLGRLYQLSRPLDFMAVTDHAFYLGVMAKMADPGHPLNKHPLAEKANSSDPAVMFSAFTSEESNCS